MSSLSADMEKLPPIEQARQIQIQLKDIQSLMGSLTAFSAKSAAAIHLRDISVKKLSSNNRKRLAAYMKRADKLPAVKRLDEVTDILFGNFDVVNHSIDHVKLYVAELYQRFEILSQILTVLITSQVAIVAQSDLSDS